jgi:hypothetical protein
VKATGFPLSSAQVRQLLGLQYHTLYRSYRRTGGYRGVVPTALPSGELLWPRAEILSLLPPKQVDLRAFLSIAVEAGLSADDAAHAIGAALLNPNLPPGRSKESLACMVSHDWAVFVRQLVGVFAGHVQHVWDSLGKADRAHLKQQLFGTASGLVGLAHHIHDLEGLAHE